MGFFFVMTIFSSSKQLQLLAWRVDRLGLAVAENLHLAKLFVGDAYDTNVAKLGHERLHPLDVYLGVFPAWTMSQIDGKLEHRETVSHDAFAEIGIGFSLFFRLCWQIEKHQHPHNAIFTETVHHNSIVG